MATIEICKNCGAKGRKFYMTASKAISGSMHHIPGEEWFQCEKCRRVWVKGTYFEEED